MPYSENFNGYTAIKSQTALGTQASGAGATVLFVSGGSGGIMSKQPIESAIIRQDAQSFRGRHGSRRTVGNYTSEMAIGRADGVWEALMRSTWSAADLAVTQATAGLTSITTTENSIVAAAGSWITAGIRVGDIVRLTGHSTAANNGRNLRVVGLTATTLTVAETLTVDAVADATFTVTRTGRTLLNGAAGALTRTYWTVEEHEYDLDTSEVFDDVRWGRGMISMQPSGNLNVEYGWTGTGKVSIKTGADAPHFTAPAEPTGLSLAASEAVLRMGSNDVLDLTSFDFTLDLQPVAPDVINTTGLAPDVFLGVIRPSINITALRKDVQALIDFDAETQLALHFMASENAVAPAGFFSLYVPNITLGSVAKSALSKSGGARTVQMTFPAELIGKDTRGGAFDSTTFKLQISNPS